jgi:hypothetical protein
MHVLTWTQNLLYIYISNLLSSHHPLAKHEQLYAENFLIKEDQSIHYLISEKRQEKKAT